MNENNENNDQNKNIHHVLIIIICEAGLGCHVYLKHCSINGKSVFLSWCDLRVSMDSVTVCNLKYLAQFSSYLVHTESHQIKMMEGECFFFCMVDLFKCAYIQDRWMNSCPSLLWMLGACIGVQDHVSCYGIKSFLSWQQYRISIFRHCTYLNLIPSDSNRKGYIWTY